MEAKPYPTDLTDAAWDCIKDLIPPPKPGGRHRELDIRAVVNAIFYVVDGGITWRMLPHEYPPWPSVYWYFSQWRDSGDWQRMQGNRITFVPRFLTDSCDPNPPASVWQRSPPSPRALAAIDLVPACA